MKFVCLLCGISSLAFAGSSVPPDADEAAYPAIERFVEVLEAVRKRHPDVDKLAYERLVNHALEGMLGSLDPHSSFIHPEMARQMETDKDLNPELPSLGITLGLRDDGPYISSVAPLGAAAGAGVLPGSGLLEINGRKTQGVDLSDLLGQLHGHGGETSRLLVKSPAAPQPLEVKLVHRVVDQRSVAETKMWNKEAGVGYVRLATFGGGCAREMEAALDELEDNGMKSLIFDLRENGGGSLDETVKILGLFLPPDTAVVTTRGREGESEPMRTPDRQRRKREYPVTVLIDRMSASASELTAGALQDLKRARIVGELSYGKGSVQNIIPMGGGTALRLTIATYHTPSGNTPHHKGITPDVVVKIDDTSRTNFVKRCQINSLAPDERKVIEEWKDPVMEAALK
ncbi:S41 family peptidase [Luteolibacter yonseiensis]|uniref:S41 family peptidase n=1 Tax=Luteolibacter yonseiensis TaxID=1144680 RepID=A0A934V827_9BACT|nr:S41 family peptidase [Luteolibacter yonseiensis]MBK1816802.1 S41 family peptidase [Luteolibacter yonseiensis]